jgi:hypothetical protein
LGVVGAAQPAEPASSDGSGAPRRARIRRMTTLGDFVFWLRFGCALVGVRGFWSAS